MRAYMEVNDDVLLVIVIVGFSSGGIGEAPGLHTSQSSARNYRIELGWHLLVPAAIIVGVLSVSIRDAVLPSENT
jgi:hypothetical protein